MLRLCGAHLSLLTELGFFIAVWYYISSHFPTSSRIIIYNVILGFGWVIRSLMLVFTKIMYHLWIGMPSFSVVVVIAYLFSYFYAFMWWEWEIREEREREKEERETDRDRQTRVRIFKIFTSHFLSVYMSVYVSVVRSTWPVNFLFGM